MHLILTLWRIAKPLHKIYLSEHMARMPRTALPTFQLPHFVPKAASLVHLSFLQRCSCLTKTGKLIHPPRLLQHVPTPPTQQDRQGWTSQPLQFASLYTVIRTYSSLNSLVFRSPLPQGFIQALTGPTNIKSNDAETPSCLEMTSHCCDLSSQQLQSTARADKEYLPAPSNARRPSTGAQGGPYVVLHISPGYCSAAAAVAYGFGTSPGECFGRSSSALPGALRRCCLSRRSRRSAAWNTWRSVLICSSWETGTLSWWWCVSRNSSPRHRACTRGQGF